MSLGGNLLQAKKLQPQPIRVAAVKDREPTTSKSEENLEDEKTYDEITPEEETYFDQDSYPEFGSPKEPVQYPVKIRQQEIKDDRLLEMVPEIDENNQNIGENTMNDIAESNLPRDPEQRILNLI